MAAAVAGQQPLTVCVVAMAVCMARRDIQRPNTGQHSAPAVPTQIATA